MHEAAGDMKQTIGITFFLHKEGGSIWNNGATANVVFLWNLLMTAGYRVLAINGGDGDAPSPAMMFGPLGIEFVKLEDVADQLDILIEAGAQVSAENVDRVRAHGGKAVAYRFGNAFIIDAERIIHKKAPGSIFNGARFDEVWTNAQHMRTCASYWETCYRAPVYCLPHIWEPTFVDAAIREFPPELTFGYQLGRPKRRISVFEPNINIVKTCEIPMLVCEQAYRARPELLEGISITNSAHLKDHLTFNSFAANLDIVRARHHDGGSLTAFEGRFNTPWFLARHTDVVVAHQWECALNYAYYDALYGGYPLIHNSDLLPADVGYRYDGFDAKDGGRALIEALQHHDERLEEYRATSNAFLETVHAKSPQNIAAHEQAIDRLMATDRQMAA